jgi:mRNA m6A methyltransferase non-catalytic subunit
MKATASLPWALQVDLRKYKLQNLMCKFDVIVIDPPWEEYVHPIFKRLSLIFSDMGANYRYCRRSSVTAFSARDVWSYNDVANLDIEAVAANPSFVWIWCGNSQNVSRGRQLLMKWGYRRCEDLIWVKTNKHIMVGYRG